MSPLLACYPEPQKVFLTLEESDVGECGPSCLVFFRVIMEPTNLRSPQHMLTDDQ